MYCIVHSELQIYGFGRSLLIIAKMKVIINTDTSSVFLFYIVPVRVLLTEIPRVL